MMVGLIITDAVVNLVVAVAVAAVVILVGAAFKGSFLQSTA